MDRRTFLVSSGAAATGLAGCLGGGTESSSNATRTVADSELTDETDGYPSESAVESTPESREVDTGSFGTVTTDGVDVPLVPVDVAYHWYQRQEARFADARGEGQYEESHVVGAVLSSAGGVENDPALAWPRDSRIVTYCGCPHHLSSIRAAAFISNGYEEVYAIDEGFFEWRDLGYPTTGSQANNVSYEIRGRTDAGDAGTYAWASHEASDQQEAAPIGDDGSYEMTLHFTDLDPSAPIDLRTPSYELTRPLSELTDSVVTGP